MKCRYFLLIVNISYSLLCAYGQQKEQFCIKTDIGSINISKSGNHDIVQLKNGDGYNMTIGEPSLPIQLATKVSLN